MTEKSSRSKAALIREYLTQYPDQGAAAIAQLIEEENAGVKVRPQEVSNIKGQMEKTGQWPPRPAEAAQTAAAPQARRETGLAERIAALREAAEAVGGPEEAKKILDLLK